MSEEYTYDLSVRSQEKGWCQLLDHEGNFICHVKEYRGRYHSPYIRDFVEKMEGHMKSFPVRDDDIFLLSYVKSGTHWLWEILMMLTRGSATIRSEHKTENMLEMGANIAAMDSPRIINTHMCFEDMPSDILKSKSAKYIQIIRNPADVAVSFYHHLKGEAKGSALAYDWNSYITKLFCDEKLMLHGTFFNYISSWWERSLQGDFKTIFYEDLHEKPREVIGQLAEFLGVSLNDELLEEIITNASFQKMKSAKHEKESKSIGMIWTGGYSMYRKGVVGDWRNYFTPEQHKQFMSRFNEKLEGFPELKEKYSKYLEL